MTDTVYHYQDESGAWQLCRMVLVEGKPFMNGERCLVMPFYACQACWVPESKLQPYHGDNQPEGE